MKWPSNDHLEDV